MAVLTSPVINWGGSGNQPNVGASVIVPQAGIAAGGVAIYTGNVLTSPNASGLAPDVAEGYATAG